MFLISVTVNLTLITLVVVVTTVRMSAIATMTTSTAVAVAVRHTTERQRHSHANEDVNNVKRLIRHYNTHQTSNTNTHSHQIDSHTDCCGDHHDAGVHLKVVLDDSLCGHVAEDARDHPDEEDRGEGAHHLRPVPAKAHPPAGRPSGHPNGEERYHEAGKVGEEVGGVRGDGKAVRQHAADHLDEHEEEAEDGGEDEPESRLLVRLRALLVVGVTVGQVNLLRNGVRFAVLCAGHLAAQFGVAAVDAVGDDAVRVASSH